MIIGEAYAEFQPGSAEQAMAAECADLGREFPGWAITWTPSQGFRASKGSDEIGPCQSRSTLRCHLAQAEFHEMAR